MYKVCEDAFDCSGRKRVKNLGRVRLPSSYLCAKRGYNSVLIKCPNYEKPRMH